jgi:uncharacterized protein YbaR (Trm112 family)/SAM-dependent methyltransferase
MNTTAADIAPIERALQHELELHGVEPDEQLYRPAVELIRAVTSTMSSDAQQAVVSEIADIVQLNSGRLFGNVNSPRGLSPDRYAILKEISEALRDRQCRHLEMGSHTGFPDARVRDLVAERRLGEFIRLDMDPQVKPDVVADCAHLPFQDASLDSVASDSLFEHMRFPYETIRESHRVLAPGGIMQIVMPFFFTMHNYPGDYMRLTPQYLEETCREVGFERVYCHVHDFGGVYYTLHNCSKQVLRNETIEPSVRDSARALHFNTMVLLLIASAFDRYFYGESRNFFIGVYCAAFKPGRLAARPEPQAASALERMLPYLACPVTHGALGLDPDGRLSTADGCHRYAVVEGIPVLLPTADVQP